MAVKRHHYVYALIDPRTCQPFYIGKGTGDRKVRHFQSVPNRYQGESGSDKHNKLEEIKKAGFKPLATILSHHSSDDAALTAEREMIEKIGLDSLTNQNAGGVGDKSKKKTKKKNGKASPESPHKLLTSRLTPKQEAFCLAIVDPDCPNQSEAYKTAFSAGRMSLRAIATEASALMKRPDITLRVEELRNIVLGTRRYSMRQAIEGQERAVELADDTSNANAMSGAYREIAKLSDLYPKGDLAPGLTVNIHNEVRLTKVELARRMVHTIQAGVIDGKR